MLVVVAARCRGVLLPCVQDSVSLLRRKFFHITMCFVSNRHCISLWLGYDLYHLYHSLTPCGYAGGSYRSLGKGPLNLSHGPRSLQAREAWVFVGSRSRACSSSWLEGVEVFSSRVRIIWYIFLLGKTVHIIV